MKFLETIFSVKNDFNKKHKVITILGFKIKFQKKFLDKLIEDYKIMHDKSLYVGIPDDLNLQLSFNNDCNCKCKFCSEKIERDSKKRLVIPEKWLYEYLKPLYPKMSNLIPTYGEITFCREGYEYLRYIHDNYPQINIFIETNGIAFDEKWAQLASDNLMRVNFSINAIDEEHFKKTVWEKDGVYPVIEKNIQRYLDVLKEKNLFAFKPSVSCVINSTNYDTTVEFIRKYISQGIQYVIIYFDLIENNTWGGGNDVAKNAEVEQILITLIELNKLLADKVMLVYSCFTPTNEMGKYQKMVENTSTEQLRQKYPDIASIADGLPTLRELYMEKTKIRKKMSKREYSYYYELTNVCLNSMIYKGHTVCANADTNLRLRPNGDFTVCAFRPYEQNFLNYIKNDKVDWNKFFNSLFYRKLRKQFREGCYEGCMPSCPASLSMSEEYFKKIYHIETVNNE